MSSSKILWSSPEINRNRKLQNAKILNDTSIQSLKCQIILFVGIITEICLNLFFKVIGGADSSLFVYMLICKTFLTINIVFIISYIYQIIYARISIFITTRDNLHESLIKSLIFELLPQVKYYYEKLIKCKLLSHWLQREAMEQERIRIKLDEERRKTLYKMYLPSLHCKHISYGDISMKRELGMSTDMWCSSPYQNSMYKSMPDNDTNETFNNNPKLFNTSTPYSRRRVISSFPDDMALVQSPIQPMPFNGQASSFHGNNSFDPMIVKYQMSPPPSPLANVNSSITGFNFSRQQPEQMTEVPCRDVWARLGIDSRNLDQWTMNLRQWLHGTIIVRVAQEIDKLNEQFVRAGLTDIVIGECSVPTLRQLVNQHGHSFPSLSVLLTFLDCAKDQGYVVNRIKELSQGACLGKFQWDCGSTSGRHPWREHLPTDTALMLHLLAAYIDSRVSTNVQTGVNAFSQQFIIDSVHSKEPGAVETRDACALLETSVQPPHYKLVFSQTVYDIAPGRRNMLECLLLFFYVVYRDEGNLRWINLGRSGLNLNWIFDETVQ